MKRTKEEIEADSKALAEKLKGPSLDEVRDYLASEAMRAAKKVVDSMDVDGEAPILKLHLEAAKSVLNYNGLDTVKVEHSGTVKITELELDV